jgi:serine protease Do
MSCPDCPSHPSHRAPGWRRWVYRRLPAVLAVLAGLASLPAAALTPAEVFALVSPSVWRVQTLDADRLPLGQGSAVVVGPGVLVTNCHVLARARHVQVRRDGQGTSLPARLMLWDPPRDLCQLQVDNLPAPAVKLGVAALAVVGQPAYAIGHPRGLDLTMSAGLVSSFRRNAAGQLVLVQTSAAISGGSSGGGLFNEAGELLGLTTLASVTGDAQNLNFAIPADWIVDLARRHTAARQKETAARAARAAASAPPAVPPATAASAR